MPRATRFDRFSLHLFILLLLAVSFPAFATVVWFEITPEQIAALEKEAETSAPAQCKLGFIYSKLCYQCRKPKWDVSLSESWYKKAADKGEACGQTGLGVLNMRVLQPPRYEEAAKWLRLAADKGDATAQDLLGKLYRDGKGVAQDASEAVKWFKLSAAQDFLDGCEDLSRLYLMGGKDFPADIDQAYAWQQYCTFPVIPPLPHPFTDESDFDPASAYNVARKNMRENVTPQMKAAAEKLGHAPVEGENE